MKTNNCYLYTADPLVIRMYNIKEVIDLYGEDYLKEFGHHVPTELIQRYQEIQSEFENIQTELTKILYTDKTNGII